jgi:hypothetical protein
MRFQRRGSVLPIVLLCAVLLVGMVVAFHFITSSDYKLAARMIQEAQARALADLAFDEVWHSVHELDSRPSAPRPDWMKELIDELDAERRDAGTGDDVDVKKTKRFDVARELPVTAAAQALATEIADLSSVVAKIGPFKVDGGPFGGNPGLHYSERVFADQDKDLRPWDLRGPLGLEVTVKGDRSPIGFSQVYQRGQMLMFTDTTPVAREFCTFVYGTPPSAEYAINDLNSPASAGFLNLHPQHDKGRIMIRGPLLVVPEEAPIGSLPKGFLGDTAPQAPAPNRQPMNYPDGKYAPELAMLPGPRELQHPDAQTGTITGVVSTIVPDVLEGVLAGVEARRPRREESLSHLKTKQYKFNVDVNICGSPFNIRSRVPEIESTLDRLSLVLARGAGTGNGAVYQSLDLDKASYYPPMGFFYGLRPESSQKLVIKQSVPSINDFNNSYQGIHVPYQASGDPRKFTPALGRTTGTDPNARLEGDVVVTEPVLRNDGKNQNVGLLGLYGVAQFESKTYLSIPILKLSYWLIDIAIEKTPDTPDPAKTAQFIEDNGIFKALAIGITCFMAGQGLRPSPKKILQDNRDSLARQALTNLRIDPATMFMVRRFLTTGAPPFNFPTDVGTLSGLLRDRRAAIVPFGAYTHESNFWQSEQMQPSKQAVINSLTTKDPSITADDDEVMRRLLREPVYRRPPDIAAIDRGWPVGGMPNQMSNGLTEALKNLCETYAGRLNRFNDAENKPPGDVVDALFGAQRPQSWVLPPNPAEKLRPRGVFLPQSQPLPAGADVRDLATPYNRGFFPPKYRDFLRIATRQYDTLEEYAAAEAVNANGGKVLPLKGAVFIKKLNFTGGLTYRGRGIILTYTAKDQAAPVLAGNVRPETPGQGSHLILVHRVAPEVVAQPDMPVMQLGPQFEGTVVSDTGVKPAAGGDLIIKGNLVAGLLNKAKQGAADVDVVYDPTLATPAATDGMKPLWTPELNGQVTSVNPGS